MRVNPVPGGRRRGRPQQSAMNSSALNTSEDLDGPSSSRERWKPSVTVAAVVERDGRFLLVEEHTADGLRLNQPAGHLDPRETPAHAVVREALEETAARVEPRHLVGVYLSRYRGAVEGVDVTYLRFAFDCALLDIDPEGTLDAGIVRVLWLTPDELRARLPEHRSPLVMQVVDDWLAGRRFPLDLVFTHPAVLGA
jgi:phosphatase NudJ